MSQNKVLAQLKKDLMANEAKVIVPAIKQVAKEGDVSIMNELLHATFLSGFVKAQEEGLNVLNNIKVPESLDSLIEALKNEKFKAHRSEIAAAIWQAGLNPEDRLIELVEIAVDSDYMTIVEVTTIIENIESGFPYEEVSEAALIINEHILDHEDESRVALLSSLSATLNSMVAG